MHLYLLLFKANLILECFTVRIHSNLARYPWARLWYLLRAFDGHRGSGRAELPPEMCAELLGVSTATIYRWLQEGKKAGAFRFYQVRKGYLKVYLGSLFKVCWNLNLRNWGEVGVCYLWEVNAHIRAITTAIAGQALQNRSRYAANRNLKKDYREHFGAPHPNELLGVEGPSSLKSPEGEVPFVLHRSEKRVFVSKGFTHYGARQTSIADALGISDRTVRRHQAALDLKKLQICQAKGEYARVSLAWDLEFNEFMSQEGTQIGYKRSSNVASVYFSDGIPTYAKEQTPNAYICPEEEFGRRFFKIGDKVFIARCNVYAERFTLTTMRAAKRWWNARLKKLSQCQFQSLAAGGVVGGGSKNLAPSGI